MSAISFSIPVVSWVVSTLVKNTAVSTLSSYFFPPPFLLLPPDGSRIARYVHTFAPRYKERTKIAIIKE